MAVPTTREREATEQRLAAWLAGVLPDAEDVAVSVHEAPTSTGFSSETVPFDARWIQEGQPRTAAYVARIRPAGYTLFLQHDLRKQWRIMEALGRAGTVPVPLIVGHDDGEALGEPFFVMERVDGVVPADVPPYSVSGWLAETPRTDQGLLYRRGLDLLAAVHAFEWRRHGLEFLEDTTSPPAGVEAQHRHDEAFLAWVEEGRTVPLLDDALAWLGANLPDEPERVLNWGDARLGNVIFRDGIPVAVLDWEMATVGAREADLAWWLVFNRLQTEGVGRPNLPGFPDDADAVVRYEAVSGHRVEHLRFYEVRAAFRAGALLYRYRDALVANGTLRADAGRGPDTPAMVVLDRLLHD